MRSIFSFRYLLVLAFIIVLAGCDDSNNFPDEPVINSLTWDSSLRHLIVEFTDGDGDFGISANDPNFPYYSDSVQGILNPYYYNLWIDYFERREGEWVLIEPESTFNFRVGVLTPDGQNKQLEVRITNDMSFEIPYPFAESDTIRFTVTLVDRSLRQSIPVTTDLIYAPQ